MFWATGQAVLTRLTENPENLCNSWVEFDDWWIRFFAQTWGLRSSFLHRRFSAIKQDLTPYTMTMNIPAPQRRQRRFRPARWLAGLLAAAALLALVFAWHGDRPVAELAAKYAWPDSQFVAIGGLDVHLVDRGPRDDPVPYVLLHGTSASLHTWEGWIEALSHTRRVVAYDLPGYGLTGPRPDGDYSVAADVALLRRLLDRLGIERAVIAGNSLGGHIAWESALAMPERVAGLVLIDSGGIPFTPEHIPLGFKLARLPLVKYALLRLTPRPVVAASVRAVYGDPARVGEALVDRYFELTLRAGNRRALLARLEDRNLLSSDPERLRGIEAPTLIIWGAADRLIPPKTGLEFNRLIPASRLVILPGLGHVPQEEAPEATLALLAGER